MLFQKNLVYTVFLHSQKAIYIANKKQIFFFVFTSYLRHAKKRCKLQKNTTIFFLCLHRICVMRKSDVNWKKTLQYFFCVYIEFSHIVKPVWSNLTEPGKTRVKTFRKRDSDLHKNNK